MLPRTEQNASDSGTDSRSERAPFGPFTLGLDLGSASAGWAITKDGAKGSPQTIERAGAHLFDAGVSGSAEQIVVGRDEPKAKERRDSRSLRRGLWRRRRRKRKLLRALQAAGLIPEADTRTSEQIDALIKKIDAQLRPQFCKAGEHADQLKTPYLIRAKAIQQELDAVAVGRALYHLGQRRGFLSNRRAPRKQGEDKGEVETGIGDLRKAMRETNSPTLGAHLATLDPTERRIRARWTGRLMYEEEFEQIWATQAPHHASMTEEAKKAVHQAIFHQRPLRSQKGLVGHCSILPNERRAPVALRIVQRFRMLQRVNDLLVETPGASPRKLTDSERKILLDKLDRVGSLKFGKLHTKAYLGLPRGTSFNLERGEEEELIGNRTDARLRSVFGERFDELTERERDELVNDLRSIRLPEALERRGQSRWGLSDAQAAELADLQLEDGHASLSVAAIRKLLPLMEEGAPYATARLKLFPESVKATQAVDFLPPVLEALPDLRNPSVIRSLTELRKIVNEIIRRYGKPERIHIELARELKQGRARRVARTKQNKDRQRERAKIKELILKETGHQRPSRDDIERVLLADECGWTCPFTGRDFGIRDLLGPEPQFDVEHIWPLSRSMDDGFLNKTICHAEENRNRKRNRTPHEAYGAMPDRFEEILQRVRSFRCDPRTKREKLRRFLAEEIPAEFTNRLLNETAYMSRLAADYLGLLYGGRSDASGKLRVWVRSGTLTWWLRTGWGLDTILSEDGKNRSDHRHHAIDAIVVALSSQSQVKALADAASRASSAGGGRRFKDIEQPWPTIREEVERVVKSIVVSHRQSRSISGAMHADSLYSPKRGPEQEHRIRKPLVKMTRQDVDKIIDHRTRTAVISKLDELAADAPEKAFEDPANLPTLPGANGGVQRIRGARIRVRNQNLRPIGSGGRQRFVAPTQGSNHHTMIVAKLDSQGREVTWEDYPVSLFDAYRALGGNRHQRTPLFAPPDHGVLKFTLAPNEYIEMDDDQGGRKIYRVLSISKGDIELREHFDARNATQIREAKGARVRARKGGLFKRKARKVWITPLGEVRRASD